MNTRMNKYYNDNEGKRVHKNEDLYKNVNHGEIDDFDLNSNMSIIGDTDKNINIDALKDILDKKYSRTPQRKSIVIEDDTDENEVVEKVDEEKDYDINAVLEKARSQKKFDYEEDRLKKGSNVDFDELNINKREVEIDEETDDQLMTLINTIASNEINPIDPLDILSDLKGDDDTIIVEGTNIAEYAKSDTKTLESLDNLREEIETQVNEEKEEEVEEKKNTFDDSFYTSSMKLKKKDFAEINDDIDSSTKGVKILITVLSVAAIIILIIGIFLLLSSIFDFNLLDYFRK